MGTLEGSSHDDQLPHCRPQRGLTSVSQTEQDLGTRVFAGHISTRTPIFAPREVGAVVYLHRPEVPVSGLGLWRLPEKLASARATNAAGQ